MKKTSMLLVGLLLLLGSRLGAAEPVVRIITLDEALRTAQKHQPQLKQAQAATASARARADQARAGLLPQAALSVGYKRTTANYIPSPGTEQTTGSTSGSTETFNSFSGSASVSQLIWDFNQTLGKWRSAQALARAQAESERAVEAQAALSVRTTYFTARADQGLAAVARDTLQNLQRHLEQTQAFVDAGTHPEIDLAQARTNVATGRAQVVTAENAYQISKAQLNQAMGTFGPTDYEIADEPSSPVDVEEAALEPLVDEAIKARPEIAALDRQVEAQQQTIRSAKGAYWPSLSANVGGTQGGVAVDNLGWNVQGGVALSWPIFQGLFTDAQVQEAEATANQIAAELELTRQQIQFDVEQARLNVRAAKATLDAQREAAASAREQLRLAEGRYQAGVGDSVEFSDAQVAYATAQAQAILADQQLATARAQLLHALGRQ